MKMACIPTEQKYLRKYTKQNATVALLMVKYLVFISFRR